MQENQLYDKDKGDLHLELEHTHLESPTSMFQKELDLVMTKLQLPSLPGMTGTKPFANQGTRSHQPTSMKYHSIQYQW